MKKQIDDLTLVKLIGKGSFGEVYLTQKYNSTKLYATKKVDKNIADSKMKKYFKYEINILRMLNHPNIVKLEEVKVTQHNYYIVMEYINGGQLSYVLKQYKLRYQKAFSEEIVQYLMKQIIDALIYIHDINIIHRDLKLENIMVNFDTEKDKEELNMMKAKIKIIDFGLAIILPSYNSLTNTAVGTMLYMDPKLLEEFNNKALFDKRKPYGKEADIWSLGCICYELFRGKYPFEAQDIQELYTKISHYGKYKVPKTASLEIISFLEKMLQYDGKFRLSARELMKEPFMTKNVNEFHYMKKNKQKNGKMGNEDGKIFYKNSKTFKGYQKYYTFNDEDKIEDFLNKTHFYKNKNNKINPLNMELPFNSPQKPSNNLINNNRFFKIPNKKLILNIQNPPIQINHN